MGYSYRLVVEEDLDRLHVPTPAAEAVDQMWREQGGLGDLPGDLAQHVAHAWRWQWFEQHRSAVFDGLDAFEPGRVTDGWRWLLDEMPVLHHRFYSEDQNTYFNAADAIDVVIGLQRAAVPPELVGELAELERALRSLARRGLRFRFDFMA